MNNFNQDTVKFFFPIGVILALACMHPGPTQTSPASMDTSVVLPLATSLTSEDSAMLQYVTGQFVPESHPSFIIIPLKYADREGMYLRKEALEAFEKMHAAASQAGIQLKIISATRNFSVQKRIWEDKWTGKRPVTGTPDILKIKDPAERARRILLYSSMPGTSRHHWGTDIDLNALDNGYFNHGAGLKIYNWLQAHAAEYGFCQPYTAMGPERPAGYQEEKWHWTFRPVADPLTSFAALYLHNSDIKGFLGSESAVHLDVVHNYILGINKRCMSK